jgi:hypothetical protein
VAGPGVGVAVGVGVTAGVEVGVAVGGTPPATTFQAKFLKVESTGRILHVLPRGSVVCVESGISPRSPL